MQTQKEEIRQRVLYFAKDEFLKKGFKGASIRDIASRAEVTFSNIYNYFKNKDQLFYNVLKPLLLEFKKLEEGYDCNVHLSLEVFDDEQYQRHNIIQFLNLIKKFRSELKILLFMSFGSSLENFKDTFINRHSELGIAYMKALKSKFPTINIDLSPFFLHTMSSWWLAMLGEIITHDELLDEEIDLFLRDYTIFVTAGWKKLMNIR